MRLRQLEKIPFWGACCLLALAFLVGAVPLAALSVEGDLGSDHAGGLWAWNRDRSELVLVPKDGPRRVVKVGAARAVDAHAEWGVATAPLDAGGYQVKVVSWDGAVERRVSLPLEICNLAWLGPGKVVVALSTDPSLLGVLDLETGEIGERIGEAEPAPTRPGAYFGRATLLAVDLQRERIHTLDGFSGAYRLFAFSGAELGSSAVANPERPRLEEWLAGWDAEARQRGRVEFATMWSFPLALDGEGKAWTVQACEPATGRVVLARFEAGSEPALHELSLDCCTRNMTILSGNLVMAPGPRTEEGLRCNLERRLPR